MSRAATPDAPTAIASEARRRRARVVARGSLDLLRSPAARRFGFELERGRLRPAGLSAPARWLTLLGLATLGFLCVAVLVPGVAVLGPASFVRAIGLGLVVHTGTVGATVLVLGIGWELLVYGASRAAPSIRVATGVLFFFSNGLLIANLTITPSAGWAAVLFSDVAKTCLVAVTVVLVVGAFVREGPAGRRRDATSILRLAPCLLTAVMSGALLVLEGAGQGPAGVRGISRRAPFSPSPRSSCCSRHCSTCRGWRCSLSATRSAPQRPHLSGTCDAACSAWCSPRFSSPKPGSTAGGTGATSGPHHAAGSSSCTSSRWPRASPRSPSSAGGSSPSGANPSTAPPAWPSRSSSRCRASSAACISRSTASRRSASSTSPPPSGTASPTPRPPSSPSSSRPGRDVCSSASRRWSRSSSHAKFDQHPAP